MRKRLLLIPFLWIVACGRQSTDVPPPPADVHPPPADVPPPPAVVQPPPDRCQAAHQWIAEHRGSAITYDELLRFPLECRRLIYSEQTAEAQSALWRTQYARYRTAHPALSNEKQAVLLLADDFACPEILATGPDGPWKELRLEFERRAIHEFGTDETRRLFGQLGPSAP